MVHFKRLQVAAAAAAVQWIWQQQSQGILQKVTSYAFQTRALTLL
jgi:hypothetical protein